MAARSASSLARGAAATTIATAVSRATGFARVVAVAGAMGTTFLANTYQTANTAPNVVFELVAAGVLTSIFVPTFVEHLVRREPEEGWDSANVLTSVALVGLVGLAVVVALGAPYVMTVLTLGVENDRLRQQEIALGTAFLRLFAPQVVFYGAGMIMTAALHAHRRFALPAVAPIFNNVVVICVYLGYAALRGDDPPSVHHVTPAETLLLGAGTTMGVVAMTACLVPPLRRLGWRFRWRFQPRHPAVGRAARLGGWALGYAGGYQAGLIVVLLLANRVEGGVAAYQWAYTFFYMPHALFGVPIFSVLFTAMSEEAARGDPERLASRLIAGLRMLAFILLPVSAAMVAVAEPLARVTLEYGVMTEAGAALVARVIQGFALGLAPYSAFLVFTRAYYSLGDAKTPALVNLGAVIASSVLGAFLFLSASATWAVAALALAHSVAFTGGLVALGRLLARRVATPAWAELAVAVRRAAVVALLALAVMAGATHFLPQGTKTEALTNLAVTAGAGAAIYFVIMHLARAPELDRLKALVRGGIG